MSKYHTIKLDEQEYTVRDVPYLPNSKKFRIGTIELRDKILALLESNTNIQHLRFISNRIHFFVEHHHLHKEDEELNELIEKHLSQYKNNIEIPKPE